MLRVCGMAEQEQWMPRHRNPDAIAVASVETDGRS